MVWFSRRSMRNFNPSAAIGVAVWSTAISLILRTVFLFIYDVSPSARQPTRYFASDTRVVIFVWTLVPEFDSNPRTFSASVYVPDGIILSNCMSSVAAPLSSVRISGSSTEYVWIRRAVFVDSPVSEIKLGVNLYPAKLSKEYSTGVNVARAAMRRFVAGVPNKLRNDTFARRFDGATQPPFSDAPAILAVIFIVSGTNS